jgi:two-component system phosphate regulon sensor histidine kinase PhoR
MVRRRLFWRLYSSYLVVTALCILGVTIYAVHSAGTLNEDQTAAALDVHCQLIEGPVRDLLLHGDAAGLDALCKSLGSATQTRFTVIDPDGRVLGDTEADPRTMENHAGRPEVTQALGREVGRAKRHSRTTGIETMYVAIPVADDGRTLAVLRAAAPLTSVNAAASALSRGLWLCGLIVAVAAAAVAFAVFRHIAAPLEDMVRVASLYADGDLSARAASSGINEFDILADTLNRMAEGLHDRIETVNRQNLQYEAVLSGMSEGVIALDAEDCVLSINAAACDLLEVDHERAGGRTLTELTRNVPLERLVGVARGMGKTVEGEAVLHDGAERTVLVRAAPLRNPQGGAGVLIVMNEVTQVRHLEKVRRDFVANVSHELRTPITAIQGFVETLRDGALGDPERAHHFLEILSRQALRLGKIVDDLLALSRIEKESEAGALERSDTRLADVLHAALSDGTPPAKERGVEVRLKCPDDLRLRINPHLIEQAVANLLDNAVKYSNPGGIVDLEAARSGAEVVIIVRDKGVGIPSEHLSRIFERFYCVDKARSRNLGGTGLGLAIVKHIAMAHDGRVEVESTLGKGSTFTIRLPAA